MVRNRLLPQIKSDLDSFHSRQPIAAAKPADPARDPA
jgi:hypothetical protein